MCISTDLPIPFTYSDPLELVVDLDLEILVTVTGTPGAADAPTVTYTPNDILYRGARLNPVVGATDLLSCFRRALVDLILDALDDDPDWHADALHDAGWTVSGHPNDPDSVWLHSEEA